MDETQNPSASQPAVTAPDPALQALQELPLPEPIAYTPQTAGWWILAGILLLLMAWGAWRWHKRRMAKRYRVEALQELDRIERELQQAECSIHAAAQIPVLVKRVALNSAPRIDTAALSGDAWLAWLDASLPNANAETGFLNMPGRLLPQLAYTTTLPDMQDLQALLKLVRHWIRNHHVRV